MGSMKKRSVASLVSAGLALLLAGVVAAAAEGGNSVAISVDGMTPMPETYEIPVGSEQGFSVLSITGGSPAGLMRIGEAEWSLAADGNASIDTVAGEYVATVHATGPGEAGLYVATPDGASDMVTLVFSELKPVSRVKQEGPSSVTVVQPAPGAVVYMAETGATVPVVAETNAPDETGSVVFTWPDRIAPAGIFKDVGGAPFWATIPEATGIGSVDVEAFSKDGGASATAHATTRGAWVGATAADRNRDGFPDVPFGLNLAAGDLWVCSPTGPDGLHVVMAGLPFGSGATQGAGDSDVFSAFVAGDVGLYEVRVPRELLGENESGIVVIGEAPDVTLLPGANLAAVPPVPADAGALLSSVLLVDVLVRQNGSDSWASAGGRLAEIPLEVRGYDIPEVDAATNARVYALDAMVADGGSPNGPRVVVPEGAAWRQAPRGVALERERFSAEARAPGVLALFETDGLLNITGINNVAIGGARDYAIGGGIVEITAENPGGVSARGLEVVIGGQAAAVSSIAGEVITVIVPRAADLEAPAANARVDIRVEVAGTGMFDAIPDGFTYLGPDVASVTPVYGPSLGGTDVVLAGNGFDTNGTDVYLGGAPVVVRSVTANAVAGTTSASDPGAAKVDVLTANNFRGTLADGFTYTVPAPVLTRVFPSHAPASAQSTLRLEGSFFGMRTGSGTLTGSLTAFFDADVENPAPGSEAAHVMFRDETHIEVVTPEEPPAGATGLFVRAKVLDESVPFTATSNVLPFSFVDDSQTGMAITGVVPAAGPVPGGNVVRISGRNFPVGAGELTHSGNVVRVARVATKGARTVEVPVWLIRGDEAAAAPSSIRFFVGFDSGLFSYAGHAANPVLAAEYGKSVVCSPSEEGVGVLVYGGMEEITLEGQAHSLELCRLIFEVDANSGESAVFPVCNLSMAGPFGAGIARVYGDAGVVTIGERVVLPEPPRVFFGANAARVIAATDTGIQVIAPAGVRQGTVDVVVDGADSASAERVAVSAAFSGEGYTYLPERALQVNRVLVSESDGALSPEGGGVILAGEGFRNVGGLGLVFADGALVELDAGFDFVVNNDGRITLTITPERLAEMRAQAGLDEAVAPGGVSMVLETASGTKTVENAFTVGGDAPEMVVSGISPAGAWIIGGLVAEVVGENFGAPDVMTAAFEYRAPEKGDAAETVSVPLEILTGPAYPNSATRLYVRIPPLPGVGDGWPASVTMGRLVVAREGFGESSFEGGEHEPPFTYYRWQSTERVATTAFYYENAWGAEEREIVLDNGAKAALSIPPLDGRYFDEGGRDGFNRVYVLARAARDETVFGEAGSVVEVPGEAIAGAWAFDIHLYTDGDGESLLSSANSLLYEEIRPEFEVPVNSGGTQVRPARLTIPIAHAALTVGDVRSGTVTVHGMPSALDDLSAPGVKSASIPEGARPHAATILERFNGEPEVLPVAAGAADDQVVEEIRARLYGLGFVALRQGAGAAPEPVLTSVSCAEGPVSGGTEVVLYGKGLGWVESVEFGGAGKGFTKAKVVGGDEKSEFAVRVVSPKVSKPGTADIRITTVTGKEAVLKNAFTYKAAEDTVTLSLGLGVALIGIFSGGKGGSGGGPCFIATAAYGTSLEGDIEVLRAMRDTYLLDTALGTAFVDAYYSVSPVLAGVVAKSPVLSALVRMVLVPVIALCKLVLAMPQVAFGVGILAMGVVVVSRLRRRLRRI